MSMEAGRGSGGKVFAVFGGGAGLHKKPVWRYTPVISAMGKQRQEDPLDFLI